MLSQEMEMDRGGKMILKGKSAIITGAGSGVGRAIALEFAREGCNVLVNDINAESAKEVVGQIEEMGRQGHFFRVQ